MAKSSKTQAVQSNFNFGELFRFSQPYTRQRYWAVKLIGFGAGIFIVMLTSALAVHHGGWIALQIVASIALMWVSFATTVKRLRDAGLSLLWALLNFIPFLNMIAFVVFGCLPSSDDKTVSKGAGLIIGLAVLMGFCAFSVLAVAAYLVYNQQHSEYVAEEPRPEPAPVPMPAPEPAGVAAPEPAPEPMPAPAN